MVKPESCICDTCHKEITDDLCRFLILNDLDNNPRVMFFHKFFPCWSFKNFCKKYSNLKIVKMGYDVDEKIYDDPKFVKQLESDLKLWL